MRRRVATEDVLEAMKYLAAVGAFPLVLLRGMKRAIFKATVDGVVHRGEGPEDQPIVALRELYTSIKKAKGE